MKTLYFDCSSGISGNMTLGALLEIIGDDNYLLEELKKLNIDGNSKNLKGAFTPIGIRKPIINKNIF